MSQDPSLIEGSQGSRHNRRRRFNNNRDSSSSAKINDVEKKLLFRPGGAEQAANYIKICKELVNTVKMFKPYGVDMAVMIQKDKESDFESIKPRLQPIEETFAAKKALLEKEAEREFLILYEEWRYRVRHYEHKKTKLCGIIINKCHQELIDKLESRADFDDISTTDPLAFLRAIKAECLTYKNNEYPMAVQIMKIMSQTINMRQHEGESVGDYARRAKAQWDLFFETVDVVCTRFVQQTVNNFDSQDAAAKYKKFQNAKESMTAYMLLTNSDRKRYGDLVDNVARSYAVGTKQYPATFDETRDILEKMKVLTATKLPAKSSPKEKLSAHNNDSIGTTILNLNSLSQTQRVDAMTADKRITTRLPARKNLPFRRKSGSSRK